MTAPSIDWGHPGFVVVNLVEAFGVDASGVADAGAQINAALAKLSAAGTSGQAAELPTGTYLINTAISNPNNVPISYGVGIIFTGTYGASMASLATPPRINTLATQAILMFSGDSITAGGASVMDDTTNAWRYACWKGLRAVRGNIRLLGDEAYGVYDNRAALSTTANPPGDSDFGDWRCAAVGGHTLSQIITEAAAVEAAQGYANVYVLLGGEDDIQAGITAGHTNAVIEAAVIAGIQAYCTARPRTATAILIYPLTPHGVGLASYVQSNVIQTAINAALPAAVASWGLGNVYFMTGSVGTVTQSDLNSTGQHPALPGYARMGREIADAILSFIGLGGKPDGQRPLQRLPAPRLLLAASGAASIADPTIVPQGTESFSMGIVLIPSDLSAQRVVFWTGPDSALPAGSIWLLAGPDTSAPGTCELQFYINGIAYYVGNDSLELNKAHYIAVTFDNVLGVASVYCLRPGPSGAPVTTLVSMVLGVPAQTWATATRADLGALLGVNCVPGLRGDFWIARGAVLSVDQIEEWYNSGALPAGTTAYYPLNEGTGTTLNPAPAEAGLQGTGTCANSWSAAGLVDEPTHRYKGSAPIQRPQAGIYMLPTTDVTGTITLTDSDVVDEARPAWNYAKILYATSSLTGNIVVNVPPDVGRELIIDTSGVTLNGHTFTVNGISVGAAVSRAYFNPAGTLVAA